MINWLWNLQKKRRQKKIDALPKKRRIFPHEARPLIDEMILRRTIRAMDIRTGILRDTGEVVEVLFYGKERVDILNAKGESLQVQNSTLTPQLKSLQSTTRHVPEFAILQKNIESDDQTKGIFGRSGDKVLIFGKQEGNEFPYKAWNIQKDEYFNIKDDEVKWTNEYLSYDIVY